MKIIVNDKELEVSGERPLIDELRDAGYDIPSLCYSSEASHQASCMVCVVRNVVNGQMLPSCSTFPTDGMQIDTESDEVKRLRRMSLELLLSDHRADCEAPCTVVCPSGIDVAQLLLYYDRGLIAEAAAMLRNVVATSAALPCEGCKAPCEKACRRGRLDSSVAIRDIIREVASYDGAVPEVLVHSLARLSKEVFSSRIAQYNDVEKDWLKAVYSQPSHCLHCACEGRGKCKLRDYATRAGIKSSRFGVSSRLPVKEQQHVVGRLYFEPAKCIRCGLCVYNTDDAFTFMHRGFDMQVIIPEESRAHASEDVASLCPTGALFLISKSDDNASLS